MTPRLFLQRLLLIIVCTGAGTALTPCVEGEDVDPNSTVADIDQRVRILERRDELDKEKQAEKERTTTTFSAGKEGITFRSADGAFQLRIRGYVQSDSRFFLDDDNQSATDTFLIRRARPIFEATVYRNFDIKLMPDFGEGRTVLQEAYLDARFAPQVKLRAGKVKTPFGLERLQSARDLLFVERSLPTNLAPNRDIGLQLHGDLRRGAIAYAVGIFNGVSDGSSADSDLNDSKEGAARLFVMPFKNGEAPGLQGLGFGLAATYGSNQGTPLTTGLAGYRTAGQQIFFAFRSNGTAAGSVIADGRRSRLSPQAFYYAGRFGLQAEFVTSAQEVLLDATRQTISSSSWQASASILLTDDKASWSGIEPRRPFDPANGSWGAFEIAARAGRLAVERSAFPVFANPAGSAREAFELAVGFNWYLNRGVRLMLDYNWTAFEGGAPAGDRADEKAILGRLQIAF